MSPKKVALIAGREFMAAVSNKGFVIGLLIMPVMFAVLFVAMPRLMSASGREPVRGEVAIVDPTARLTPALRQSLSPAAIEARRQRFLNRALDGMAGTPGAEVARNQEAAFRTTGPTPEIHLMERPATADLTVEKRWLTTPPAGDLRPLALVVVKPDAVELAPGQARYGAYDLFVPPNTDERIENEVRDGLRDAIVAARLAARRLDVTEVEAMTAVPRVPSITVGPVERQTSVGFNRFVPFVFVGLLVFGVMIGAQTLMTSTVEEKSSRVMEVLLSAVSPLELMAGKVLGQMAVSLLVLALYVGIGVLMLTSFAMIGLLDPWLIFYLVIFFLITYFLFASVFGAIGAAVNEMREAQALVTPVMLVLMVPWLMAAPVAREPNSTFAIALSFIPPVNTLAMMIRMASTSPPPAWQVWITIGIGLAAACAATWMAAKIFRVGLLMYGKPPNFATLLRWARQS
jgi:ABC-2 type transport system permease protein